MTMAKQRKKRKATGGLRTKTRTTAGSLTERVAQLEEWAEITGGTISSINRSVAMASDSIDTLNGSLKATIIYGSRDVTRTGLEM